MPTISFVNSKGGCGKTTTALVVALELAQSADVIVIDADPNQQLTHWASGGQGPENLRVVSCANPDAVAPFIEKAEQEATFVIADLEGRASLAGIEGILRSDLVVIASTESPQDERCTVATVAQINKLAEEQGRAIPYVSLLTRTEGVKMGTARSVNDRMRDTPILRVLAPELMKREAFLGLFEEKDDFRNRKNLRGLPQAVENSAAVTGALISELRRYM